MATNWEQKPGGAALPDYSAQPVPPQQSPTPGPYPPQQQQQQYFTPQPTGQPIPMQQVPGQPQVVYMQGAPLQQQQTMPMQQMQQQQLPGARVYQNSTPLASLGRSPAPIDCPACGQRSMSRIEHVAGNYAHGWAIGLCCITGFFCFVPYIVDGFKDVDHHCGQCGVMLATWHRSGGVEVHQHS